MQDFSLNLVEFDAIKGILSSYCASSLGRGHVDQLAPLANISSIVHLHRCAQEMIYLHQDGNEPPMQGLKDLNGILDRASIEGAALDAEDFSDLESMVLAGRRLRKFILSQQRELPLLTERVMPVQGFSHILQEINRIFDEQYRVKDNASPQLSRIRRRIESIQGKIQDILNRYLKDSRYASMIQDAFITTRDGRYCLPVDSSFKGRIKGIVHQVSASGATTFIEPEDIVPLGNELTELAEAEADEIHRIMVSLTDKVRENIDDLKILQQACAWLDFNNAKARFANDYMMSIPKMQGSPVVELKGARHPLLIKTKGFGEVVPINVILGRAYRCLVITGPNTGGKTVALKTVGLLCTMAQAGLPIPASPDSTLGIYGHILADIGEEQDIVQSLSTFSSHIERIREITRKAKPGALILLDELGAGTDPAEGSALGIAILRYLLAKGAHIIATTHHDSLKAFAYADEDAENASVEFDPKTLEPKYRLNIGVPGRSNAFIIAERLRMPSQIIQDARSLKQIGSTVTQDLVDKLQEDAQELERKVAEYRQRLKEQENAQQELKESLEQARIEAESIINKANQEAASIIADAIAEYKKALKQASQTTSRQLELKMQRLKAKHEETASEASMANTPAEVPQYTDSLKAGDFAALRGSSQPVKIVELDYKQGYAVVLAGSLKMKVPYERLEALDTGKADDAEQPDASRDYEHEGVSLDSDGFLEQSGTKLNIIGRRVDEAIQLIDRFLDQALLEGYEKVHIIHGLGAGKLMRGIHEHLAGQPFIKRFYQDTDVPGGGGVTIVVLK